MRSLNPAKLWGPKDLFSGVGYHTHNSSGSFSLTASHLLDQEALTRKTAAAISSALSIAEYIHNQPEISDESKAGLHHLNLDVVSAFKFSWRMVYNDMLMRRSITLENLSRSIPLVDEDQNVAR